MFSKVFLCLSYSTSVAVGILLIFATRTLNVLAFIAVLNHFHISFCSFVFVILNKDAVRYICSVKFGVFAFCFTDAYVYIFSL